MPSKRSRTRKKPLRISIHGRGIDIDATIADADEIRALMAELATEIMSKPADHDFDVVQRVLKIGNSKVVQAIADLANHEVKTRGLVSN